MFLWSLGPLGGFGPNDSICFQELVRKWSREWMAHIPQKNCTRVRGTPCCATLVALHASQQISSESWGFSRVATVSRYTPPKRPCRTCHPSTAIGVARQAASERCRATGRCSSYTCGCPATLCNYDSAKKGLTDTILGVLSHHLKCEMKSPHLVNFSWDVVDF